MKLFPVVNIHLQISHLSVLLKFSFQYDYSVSTVEICLFFFFCIIQTIFVLTLSVIAHNYSIFLDYKVFVLLMLLDQSFFSIKVFVDKLCYSWSFQRLACLQMFLYTLLAYVVSGYNYGITVPFPL